MSWEAIEKITKTEQDVQERRAAAEAEAGRIVAEAERNGQLLLEQARTDGLEAGRRMLQQAEEQAKKEAERIAAEARRAGEALRTAAEKRLDRAAALIVGKVVKR